MKAIVYHYVRGHDARFSRPGGIRRLEPESFRRQLDHLQQRLRFPDASELIEILSGRRSPPEPSAVLTFDDGLRDHHQVVYPELRSRMLPAIFYVPTAPMVHGSILPVHAIHHLLGAVEADTVLQDAMRWIDAHRDALLADHRDEYLYRHRGAVPQPAAALKRLINGRRFLRAEARRALTTALLARHLPDLDPATIYMSRENIQEMSAHGMIMGAHSMWHDSLCELDREEQREEILGSLAAMEGLGGPSVRTFAFPYGGFESFDGRAVELLLEAGVDWCFSLDPTEVTAEQLSAPRSRQFLPRFDCRHFPHGAEVGSAP
ncbi:polysaccharide deacetylase family protein [Paraliomyxa miuraensis]|uniref:polysaccharide deacetylase family protein n=1 Tax=Paraliomyxa miuraensis TaxID=376150 RepID=UPI00225B6DAF|nr:polysaccharide deacetylase family protein [Paraliomyxa miuraensis]MCX4243623.1 polysaccharide deacetylase family protein [Paraliomyxa miuraensis]